MKSMLEDLVQQALNQIEPFTYVINMDRSKDPSHGDYTTNIAMILAKKLGMAPRVLAQQIVDLLPEHALLTQVEIAGPGFINFFLCDTHRIQSVLDVLAQGSEFGFSDTGKGIKVLLEYVSANPTGPLHVGHGRSAAFGASLSNLLKAAGYTVLTEYYVNDAGRQMDILAVSVWLRYLESMGEPIVFPSNAYKGAYVQDMAASLAAQHGTIYVRPFAQMIQTIPPDTDDGGDQDQHIDAWITCAKSVLGLDGFAVFHQYALKTVLADIKEDLSEFGVIYDRWFSEQSLLDEGSIQAGIDALRSAGHTYEETGALWFRATSFGDDKDRVLVRANGQPTYFASDVAYHWNKYQRGVDRVIDVFGADHHGYLPRLKAAVTALGHDEHALTTLLVQFAILYRAGKRVQMSTRSGSFVTLRELRNEVGVDAARFFYLQRKSEQHMDFDLDLAKSETNDNPVYYIQYAHARICSVLRQLNERGLSWSEAQGILHLAELNTVHETALMTLIQRYPDLILDAAQACEPHQVTYYLRELATGLHCYYNAVTLLCEDQGLRDARLCLLTAVRQVLRNGLKLLGVSAPESM